MLKETSTIWADLVRRGAKEEEREEIIPTGYKTETYRVIKFRGLEFEIRNEKFYDDLFDDLKEDKEVFLVNYHRDFWIERNDIITKEETAELYRGERDWIKTEREKGYWIFELSCLIHGGVWLKLGYSGFISDPGGWDTSHVGLVLVSKKIAKTRKKAEKLAESLVDYWNKLLGGEVYRIIVRENEKVVDEVSIVGEVEVLRFIKEFTAKPMKKAEIVYT